MTAISRTAARRLSLLAAAATFGFLAGGLALADPAPGSPPAKDGPQAKEDPAVENSDRQGERKLTPQQYQVLRCSATEAPFTGQFYDHHEAGMYLCAGCGSALFSSTAKYDSGSGWPSYFQPVHDAALREKTDTSHGMVRTEILCAKCGGHLGHLFPDGPAPTGLRYCINSAALEFRKAEQEQATRPE